MIFAQYGVDGSDVDLVGNAAGELECHGCSITPTSSSSGGGRFVTDSLQAFLDHLERHSLADDGVPGHTRNRIRAWVAGLG